jgi:predicted Zn finger-like uncharacterized protein
MKITCQSCQAKYTIADEKVAGKTVKIKCKKCGATIVVNGAEAAAAAPAPMGGAAPAPQQAYAAAPPGDDDDGEGATRVFAEGSGGGGPGSVEWTVNVTDEDQRTMNAAQIVAEFARGLVTKDTYVWKDGMADWLPLSDVPELMAMCSVAAPAAPRPAAGMPAVAAPAPAPAPAPVAAAPAPAYVPPANEALGGTMIMAETPTPLAASPVSPSAQQPAAARRKAPGGGVDLFGPGAQQESAPAPAAASATTSASRLAGERNENSVLFSISALTAAAAVSKQEQDALLDLAAPSPAPRNGGRAAVDDIMNLGGGISAAPVLAPPPLLAPVVEAPPPPAPVAAPAMAAAMPMSTPDFAQKKSKTGLILGIVGGVAVLGAVGAFFAMKGGDKPAGAENSTVSTAAASATPSAAPSATPSAVADTKPADTKPADTGTPADTKPADDKKADTKAASTGAVAANVPGKAADTKKDDKKADDKKADEPKKDDKKADDKKADDKKAADTSGGGSGKEFDRGAASAALSAAAAAARGCKTADGPTGTGRVKVTFAPSGNVTSATLESGPWAGTPMAGCIVGAFRGVHVPPFDGAAQPVGKTITIN